jgi:hypothetical protein
VQGPAATLFSFPNPVNELAARTVAFVVMLMCIAAIVFDEPWLLVPVAYGFWARALTGPSLSPLGQLATRVVAPTLGPARPVPGPPKRFAQAMGAAMSSVAVVLWFGLGDHTATWAVLALIVVAAALESLAGYCLGCKVFALLMKAGVIPEKVCLECADLSRRHRELAANPNATP